MAPYPYRGRDREQIIQFGFVSIDCCQLTDILSFNKIKDIQGIHFQSYTAKMANLRFQNILFSCIQMCSWWQKVIRTKIKLSAKELEQFVSANKEMLMARLTKPHIIKGNKGKALGFFLSLSTEMANTWYELHRYLKKQNGIKLNSVLTWNSLSDLISPYLRIKWKKSPGTYTKIWEICYGNTYLFPLFTVSLLQKQKKVRWKNEAFVCLPFALLTDKWKKIRTQ